MKQILFSLVFVFSLSAFGNSVLFEDRFSSKNEASWNWLQAGSGALEVNKSGLQLFQPKGASNSTHSGSGVYSKRKFHHAHFEALIGTRDLTFGSRGWGYSNKALEQAKAELAQFVYIDGAENSGLRGFYAISKKQAKNLEFTELNEGILDGKLHRFEIIWAFTYVAFRIDGHEVARHTASVPGSLMGVHVWIDNAVYDFWNHTSSLQNIPMDTSVTIHALRIKSLSGTRRY